MIAERTHSGCRNHLSLGGIPVAPNDLHEFERKGDISFSRFYARRLLRLYPALLLMTAIASLASARVSGSAMHQAKDGILPTLSYTINWFYVYASNHHFGVFAHTWSLAIEEQFYLIWPLALLLLCRLLTYLLNAHHLAARPLLWRAIYPSCPSYISPAPP